MSDYVQCDLCPRSATEHHHCLLGRKRGQSFRDHWFNLEPLCRDCHASGRVNSYEHRREFFHKQVQRYGQPFLDWWDKLPMKVKPRYE